MLIGQKYSSDDCVGIPKKDDVSVIDFIIKQFDFYREKGINLNQIEDLQKLNVDEKKQLGYCRFQIVAGKVYAENNLALIYPAASLNMFKVLVSSLQRILKKHTINNVDFVFLAVDNLILNDKLANLIVNSPTFMMSRDSSNILEKDRLLFPDAYLLSVLTWPPLIKQIKKGSEKFSWKNKNSDKIFWRGATTGGEYNLENFDKLPRLTLVMMSKIFPNLIDARFMHYNQFSDNPSGRNLYIILNKLFDNPGRILEKDHLEYKYLISVDGNTASWLRVPWILLSNSILLKQETAITQIFYSAMQPYVHYIPLQQNLTDIFEKLSWLKANDDEAQIISENATKFVYDNLMPKQIDNYLLLILNEYHKLQRFEVKVPTLPFVEEMYE